MVAVFFLHPFVAEQAVLADLVVPQLVHQPRRGRRTRSSSAAIPNENLNQTKKTKVLRSLKRVREQRARTSRAIAKSRAVAKGKL